MLNRRRTASMPCCGAVLLVALGVALGWALGSEATSATSHDSLYVNGVPIAAHVLTVRGAPADVAARLTARWRADPATHWLHSQSLGQRVVVGRRQGSVSVAAVFAPAPAQGYSRIVISVTDARMPLRALPSPGVLRVPAGLRWLSVSESPPDSAAAQPGLRLVEYLGVIDAPQAVSQLRWIASLRRAGFAVRPHATEQIEAYRDGESLWVGLQAFGPRTGVVLQRRLPGASTP